jgi:hypothetical protein
MHTRFLAATIAAGMLMPLFVAAQTAQQDSRSPDVPRPGPFDRRLVGAWDVWISGAVTYSTDGRSVYQHYEPGAAMNRLEIRPDGGYRWGKKEGRLVEVLPWHHQADRRYYRVVHASGTDYDLYYGSGDKLVVLFGGVGGHASTGTRLSGSGGAAQTASTTSAPAPVRQSPTGAASGGAPSNPLGVEWAGSGNGKTKASGTASNPLGVEWAGGEKRAQPSVTGSWASDGDLGRWTFHSGGRFERQWNRTVARGHYRLEGNRLLVRYARQGREAFEEWAVQVEDDQLRLTDVEGQRYSLRRTQ